MADEQILVAGTAAVPLTYEVPNAIEAALLCVNATIDGTGASGQFYPTVEIISDGGVVVARCPCFTAVSSGGTAEVSWFRLRTSVPAVSTLSGYTSTVLGTAGIRSYWPLDETSGTTFSDLGPSAKNLTAVGSPTLGTPPLINSGLSATFSGAVDGLGRAVQYGLSSNGYGVWPSSGALTVEGWIKTTFGGGTSPFMVDMDNGAFRLFQVFLTNTNKVGFVTFNAGDTIATAVAGATTINDGVRHYFACTFDVSTFTMTVYVDGAADGSIVAPSAYSGDTPRISIAARQVGGSVDTPIGAVFDAVALYSRALSASEIHTHYLAGL